jgi:DNA polymerase I-like protein with 3'-5' exonuclease and polymerase domains
LVKTYADKLEQCEKDLRNLKIIKRYEIKKTEYIKQKFIRELKNKLEEKVSEKVKSNIEQKINDCIAGRFTTKKDLEKFEPLNFSSPNQMIELLFTSEYGFEFKIVKYTIDKKTKKETDRPSTDEDVLTQLKPKDKSGFIELLLNHRELSKLYSTYILGIYEKLSTDAVIHTSFLLHGTVTGRLSSREPNLQNIPRSTTSTDIKKMFIPRPGYLLLQLDYSQAELRVLASLAQEDTMLSWFKAGFDIHLATACKKRGWDYKEKLKILKDENHSEHIEIVKERKKAKTTNFGIAYEQGGKALAEKMTEQGIPTTKEQAERILKEWFQDFPKVKKYIEKQHRFAERNAFVRSIWGRKRRLPNVDSSNFGKKIEALRQSTNCVDSETEALTRRGWKNYNELHEGEDILTKNSYTGILEWQPIEKLNIYPLYKGDMFLIENKIETFSALSTPNHNWLCNPSSKRLNKNKVYTSEQLFNEPIRCIHRTGKYIFPDSKIYDDDLISFIGWILTDGSIRYYNQPNKPRNGKPWYVTLTQSYGSNKPKVEIINKLLSRLGFYFKRLDRKDTQSYQWKFNQSIAILLDKIIPYKILNMDFLLSLTLTQAHLLIESMLLGDGSGGRRLCSGNKLNSDLFQVLIIMLGKCSNITIKDQIGKRYYGNVQNKLGYVKCKNISYKVSILERDKVHTKSTRGDSYISKVNYEGLVWCPTVKNGFWVCRRKNTTYITGNSPIQGAASDFALFSSILIREEKLKGNLPSDMNQVFTVHDSLGFEIKPEDIHGVVPIMHSICLNPDTKKWFGFELENIKMEADFEVGLNWGELRKYNKETDYTKLSNDTI